MSNKKHFIWSTFNKFGVLVIYFIGNITLARLLTPDDFGLVGMLAIVFAISWNLTESGFSDFLIKKRNIDIKDFQLAFTFNIVVGTFFFIIICLLSGSIAHFFNRKELSTIAILLGLSVLLKSFTLTELTKLRKELKFKTITIIELIAGITSVLGSIILAFNNFGFMSLVYQQIILGVSYIILVKIFSDWKPTLYVNIPRLIEMYKYSIHLVFSYLISQIGQNLISVTLGKLQNASVLGLFRQAQRLKDLPTSSINSVILHTSYPILAKIEDPHEKLKSYRSLYAKILFVQYFVITFLYGLSYEIIWITYGDVWIDSVPYFKLLLILAFFHPIMTVNSNIAKIEDKPKIYRNLSIIRNLLLLSALLILMNFSLEIIIIGQIVATFISSLIDIHFCGNLIKFNMKVQFLIIIQQLYGPVIAMLVGTIANSYTSDNLTNLIIFPIVYLVTFVTVNQITKNDTYLYFKNIVIEKLNHFKK